jgi:hypothetical protein
MAGNDEVINISHTNIQSYKVVAESICRYMGIKCNIQTHDHLMFAPISTVVDVFIGSQTDMILYQYASKRAKILYITVEGKYRNSYDINMARHICSSHICITATKWGKSVFEEQGIPVADYMYHPVPPISPELVSALRRQPRPYDLVYLNSYYQLHPQNDQDCERKGWHFWHAISSRFHSIAFSNNDIPCVIKYGTLDISNVYKLLALGKVYANLSKFEGFGLNPVMSLYVGDNVVSWNTMVTYELLNGIDGAYFVPADRAKTCILTVDIIGTGSALIEHRWGSIDEFTEKIKHVLMSTYHVDYTALESRFGGHVVRVLKGYLH